MKNNLLLLTLFFCVSTFSQEFNAIWNTENVSTGSSADNEITIPVNPLFTTYDYTVDWGDGAVETNFVGDANHIYAASGEYTIKISGDFPAIYFNDSGDRLKIVEILGWGNIQWQTMENAFFGCANLNFDAIDSPDLSQVTSLKNTFRSCSLFNGIVNDWNVSTITNMSGLFANASTFNRPVDLWNTSNVTDMSETFFRARLFNEPLDNWNTGLVTTMESMFEDASNFNQNINNWNTGLVQTMALMFGDADDFDQPLNDWDVSNVTTMNAMFEDARNFNQPLNNWDVGEVTDMARMFYGFIGRSFNQPLDNWDVSKVISMRDMFEECNQFDQPLNNWDVSSVTNMSGMFRDATVFNQPLNEWDVSNVTNMSGIFENTKAFNQPLNEWDVSGVTDMSEMFFAAVFNQPLNNWNVSAVTDVSEMFGGISTFRNVFDQSINNWDVSAVTNMSEMFEYSDFNQPLNNWDISSVTNMSGVFRDATNFNQVLDDWALKLGSVTNMSNMFIGATAFNQNLAIWNITNVSNMAGMLSSSGISQENYDAILIGWNSQEVLNNVNLGAVNLQYCDALSVRQELIDDHNWTISGDEVNCTFVLCTEIITPSDGETNVPANSDIRWNPTPNAVGYRIDLEIERSGVRSFANFDGNVANDLDVGNVVGLSFTNEFLAGDIVFVTVRPYNDEGPAVGCQETSFTVVESWVNSPDAFKITFDTSIQDTFYTDTGVNQFKILTQNSLTYNYSIDWGDGQFNNNVTGDITHTYLMQGIYTVSIIGDFPAIRQQVFQSDALKILSIDQWGTQVWGTMNSAFENCENLEHKATDIPDLSVVEDMSSMFQSCQLFDGNINNWDVSNVINMASLFSFADLYNQPLDQWDVSNVTSMSFMFSGTDVFNQNIENWQVGNVISMNGMFRGTDAFNQPLNDWDVSSVTTMDRMFNSADVFNQPLNNWDVSSVTIMEEMFDTAVLFNQNINSWDVSSVTTMAEMFNSASVFNQSLNSWDVSSVTTMTGMFDAAVLFNQPLGNWDVSRVVDMSNMFDTASAFNQNINTWNVTNVTDMAFMFASAIAFNEPLSDWDVNSVVEMNDMFHGASTFNQDINEWEVSAVANMSSMFEDAILFNEPLNDWNVSSVTNMESMFSGASVFNQNINTWNVGVTTTMQEMFQNAVLFNAPLNNWNTDELLNTESMFSGAMAFNQNIDIWNTSFVITMEEMFKGATVYNQSMNAWNVASVTTMEGMFEDATAFDGNISSWNVRAVATMESMFENAIAFNQNINGWRINNTEDLDRMFSGATNYNQDMSSWILGAQSMRSMFQNASSFNQSLEYWDVSSITNMQDMLDNTALSRVNYDNTLIAWSELVLTPNINLGAEGLLYCDSIDERQSMIDDFGWVFTGDIEDCPLPECTMLISPENGAVDVPVNTNLNWDSALYAAEYDLTITLQPSGDIISETTTETSYEFAEDRLIGVSSVTVLIQPSNNIGMASGCVAESFTLSTDVATVPNCTELASPLNGATDVVIDADISWSAIADADGYLLSVGTTSGGTELVNNEDLGNVTNYEFLTNFDEDIDVFVTIVPYNEQGSATGCLEQVFRTELIPVPPICTTITNPLNDATDVLLDTSLSWNTVSDATGYLVTVGITSGGIEVANSIDVGSATSYVFPNELIENREHFVTIIPYNAAGDATGCIQESFITGNSTLNDPPACATLSSSLSGGLDVSVSTDLTWESVFNTDGYRLSVGTTSGGVDILNNEDVGNVTTYNFVNNLEEAVEVFVTIIAYNSFGDSVGCIEESFTTELLMPDCTTLSSPLNGTTGVSLSSDISWNEVNTASGYKLSVGTTSGGVDILANEDVGNVLTYNLPTDLPENTLIYVNIMTYNAIGDSVGCIEESFITEILTPDCTTITSPLNEEENVIADLSSIEWESVSDATGYYITINSTSDNAITDYDVGLTTSYDLPYLFDYEETVFVVITPYNIYGNAEGGCIENSFTISVQPKNEVLQGFSPNGDGVNDFWVIDGIEEHPSNKVTIYNRWGDIVFYMEEYDNITNVFTGIANRKTKIGADKLPEGTYFYQFDIDGEHNFKELNGFVIIKR